MSRQILCNSLVMKGSDEMVRMQLQLFDIIQTGGKYLSSGQRRAKKKPRLGFEAQIQNLLSQGVNINVQNFEGNTPLLVAVIEEKVEFVKFLIEAGANVNKHNDEGKTALKILYDFRPAFSESRLKMMKMLIEAGAHVCTVGYGEKVFENAVLNVSALLKRIDLVTLLISKGVDLNSTDSDCLNFTALHYAVQNITTEDPAVFEALLAAGADVDAKDVNGHTPLHLLGMLRPDAKLSMDKIVKVFVEYGADLYAVSNLVDNTPIDNAIVYYNTAVVKALVINGGVNPNREFKLSPKVPGDTILHESCRRLDLDTIKFLVPKGANINARNRNNETPIFCVLDYEIVEGNNHEIQAWQKTETLKYILKSNPDVNVITTNGRNILTSNYHSEKLWKLIVKHIAKLYSINRDSIHAKILHTILNRLFYKKYFDECTQELETLKVTQLQSDNRVTYFNLLTGEDKKLFQYAGKYMKNEDLVKQFNKFIGKVKIYGHVIQGRFTNAISKRKNYVRATEVLSDLLPLKVDPDHNAIQKIVSFLDFKDLLLLRD